MVFDAVPLARDSSMNQGASGGSGRDIAPTPADWASRPDMPYSRGMAAMTPDEIERFVDQTFPQARTLAWRIESTAHGRARVSLPVLHDHLRPGGTVSGPTLMTLADTAMYFAVLASIGPVELTVTTSLSINFLRKPGRGELVADAEILKLGARLAVGHVLIRTREPTPAPAPHLEGDPSGDPTLVAHATVTYSIPPTS
jgi:uncharacterized protein (TIGR00369 family)